MAPPHPEPIEPITYGSPRFRSVEAGGFLVTDACFPSGSTLPRHIHDRTCVALPIAGAFDSVMHGRSHWSGPGMIITEPAGEVHANRFGPDGTRIAIVQPDARREELLRPCDAFLRAINHRAEPAAALLARRLVGELAAQDSVSALAMEAIALELLVVSARSHVPDGEGRTPGWLARVRDRLHDDFAQTHHLQTLAEDAGVHPAHLTKAFRRCFGRSIGSYLRLVRVNWAAHRLATSEDLLAEVAAVAGFTDQSHFTRLFRQHFGCTPARYRQRVRADQSTRTREPGPTSAAANTCDRR
jgi:AraC family transcriptional regulator